MSLVGKVALVTGGSQGIGRATSLALAKEGASVVVNFSSSQGPADEVVKSINSSVGPLSETERAVAIKANVSSVSEIKRLVSETVERFGRIDILVCNAAKLYGSTGLANTSEAEFDEAFNVNVKGVYFLIQEAAPHIPDGGRIMLFSSSLTFNSQVPLTYLLYNATKGAIEQMTRILAKDLGRRGITVNTISPGPTATDAFYVGKTDAMVDMIKKWAPSARLGKPEEVANIVAFLTSDKAAWINGDNIRVNGGSAV